MKRQFAIFLLRLVLNMAGIAIAVRLFGTGYETTPTLSLGMLLVAALIFSIVNAILKPIMIVLALPAILLTLGLFTIVVNGLMVWISLNLAPGIEMTFWHSILTGLVLSLVNYIVSNIVTLEQHEGK